MKTFLVVFVTTSNKIKQAVCLSNSAEDAIERIQEVCKDFDVLSYAEEVSYDCVFEVSRIN